MKNPHRHRTKLRQILSDNPIAREVYQSLLTYDRAGAKRYLQLLYTKHNRPLQAGRPRKN